MTTLVFKKQKKVYVTVLSLKKKGIFYGRQCDFWGNPYFIIKVGKELLPFKINELRFIAEK